jgi:uncharacterized protein (DUF983 family)
MHLKYYVSLIRIFRGFKGICPKCGQGRIFESFLKVAHHCNHCNQELFHHKADDMPAYIVITIVGHIIVPLFIWVMVSYNIPDWVHFSIWIPATLILSVLLLQPVKGAIVAFQWLYKMHGFARKD